MRISASSYGIHPAPFGAPPDPARAECNYAGWLEARAALGAVGGGEILYDSGVYDWSDSLATFDENAGVLFQNITHVGCGQGAWSQRWFNSQSTADPLPWGSGTHFRWTNPKPFGMNFSVLVDVASGVQLQGGGMRGISLDARNIDYAISIASARWMKFEDVAVIGPKNTGIWVIPLPSSLPPDEPRDVQFVTFERVFIDCWSSSSPTAIGMQWHGDVGNWPTMSGSTTPNPAYDPTKPKTKAANTSFNTARTVQILHKNGHGFVIGSADANLVDGYWHAKYPSGTGMGIWMPGNPTRRDQVARHNTIQWCEASVGVDMTKLYTPYRNKALIDGGNGTPAPQQLAGSPAVWSTLPSGAVLDYSFIPNL